MENDWDLYAVVRGCAASTSTFTSTATATAATTTTTAATAVGGAPPQFSTTTTTNASQQDWNDFSFFTGFQDPFFPRTEPSFAASELHEAYKPFYPNLGQQQRNATLNQKPALSPKSLPISPLSVINGLPDRSCEQQKLMKQTQSVVFDQLPLKRQHPSVSDGPKASPRPKKRKNKSKRVCRVPVEQLASDMWAWRKYGQKPIKGSPYPRGYYRCSTSKACPARKLVERDRSDPAMFIVTFMSEHNHTMPTQRNSVAGTTRSATSATATAAAAASSVADIPFPVTSNSEKLDAPSLDHELIEFGDEDDDLMSLSDIPLEDDFFEGLEDLGQEFGSGSSVDGFFKGLC